MSHSLAKAWGLLLTGEKNPTYFTDYTSRFHVTSMLLATIIKKLRCRKVFELLISMRANICIFFKGGISK